LCDLRHLSMAYIGSPLAARCEAATRMIDNEPALHDTLYVDCERFPGMAREDFENREGTIYSFYLARYGVNIIRTVESIAATACPAAVAKRLVIANQAPVLEMTRVALTYHDVPIEYRISYMSTLKHVYVNDQGKSRR